MEQTGEHSDTKATQGNTDTAQQQDRLGSNGRSHCTNPTDSSGKNRGNSGDNINQNKQLLSIQNQTQTKQELGAGTEQTGEHTHAKATQGNTNADQQQNGLTSDSRRHLTDPTDGSSKNRPNGSQKRGNSHSFSSLATLLSHFLTIFYQHLDHRNDSHEADQREQPENRRSNQKSANTLQNRIAKSNHILHCHRLNTTPRSRKNEYKTSAKSRTPARYGQSTPAKPPTTAPVTGSTTGVYCPKIVTIKSRIILYHPFSHQKFYNAVNRENP